MNSDMCILSLEVCDVALSSETDTQNRMQFLLVAVLAFKVNENSLLFRTDAHTLFLLDCMDLGDET